MGLGRDWDRRASSWPAALPPPRLLPPALAGCPWKVSLLEDSQGVRIAPAVSPTSPAVIPSLCAAQWSRFPSRWGLCLHAFCPREVTGANTRARARQLSPFIPPTPSSGEAVEKEADSLGGRWPGRLGEAAPCVLQSVIPAPADQDRLCWTVLAGWQPLPLAPCGPELHTCPKLGRGGEPDRKAGSGNEPSASWMAGGAWPLSPTHLGSRWEDLLAPAPPIL